MTRTCRVCRCTDLAACVGGCWWVEADLCSSCDEDIERAAAGAFEFGRNYVPHYEAVMAGDRSYVCPPPGCAIDRPAAVAR